jgi:hypothetical protein
MTAATIWRTDDRCPCCGTRLQITDTRTTVTVGCGACCWSLTAEVAIPAGPR